MEYDFVVVGGGSSGCVVASRLSEGGRYSVCLIEAGGRDSSPWIHIPVGYFRTMRDSRVNWHYRTEPDSGLNGRSIMWPRGKVLGGSSSLNGLLYVRGQAEDYDHWRQLGNEGWGWDDVLPCFLRMEDWEGGEDSYRGVGGPLSISRSRVNRECIDSYIKAGVSAGYSFNEDYNGASQEGVGYFQLTIRDGFRCSSSVAYLRPARRRDNLTILTNMTVCRVLVESGRAVGVAVRGGDISEIRARREVILSSGSIGSPQLLMLSGIGSGSELSRHDIPVVCDLPGVGENLQDHLQARPVFRCRSSTLNTEARSLYHKFLMGLEYAVRRTGPMTMAASLGTGYLKTRRDLLTPDIQFHLQPFSMESLGGSSQAETHSFDAFTASVLQLRPESRGCLRLRSPHIDDAPLIHPNYLSCELDCRTLVDGIRIAREISRHEPVSSEIIVEHSPGPDISDSDYSGLLDWARSTSTTIYHPTGTCKMGGDSLSVVDSRLRVRGISSLRVVDASIMPMIVSGNTNGPSIMIGERGSDFLLEDNE